MFFQSLGSRNVQHRHGAGSAVVSGHCGSPRHALLALLHVLNPTGSYALGDGDLLRGCLAYGLAAAKQPLPEAGEGWGWLETGTMARFL